MRDLAGHLRAMDPCADGVRATAMGVEGHAAARNFFLAMGIIDLFTCGGNASAKGVAIAGVRFHQFAPQEFVLWVFLATISHTLVVTAGERPFRVSSATWARRGSFS